jgi:hypothetical protein
LCTISCTTSPGAPHCAPYRALHVTFTHGKVFAYYGFGQFNFAGDDDVWVFINFRLAVNRWTVPLAGALSH